MRSGGYAPSHLGTEVDPTWSSYNSVTDSGILDQILDECDPFLDRYDLHMKVKNEFVHLTREYIARTPDAVREIRGARALLETLEQQPSVAVAIATGGWRETAELKLRGVGLDPERIPLATASDSGDRCVIIKLAERRALNGRVATRRTYIGDGAWDKAAAVELNYSFVAVGGGVVHDVAVPDLADHAKILAHLHI